MSITAGSVLAILLALIGYPFIIDPKTEQQGCDLVIGRLARKIRTPEKVREALQNVLTKVILTLSDLQLATGLAIIIIAFYMRCTISLYHFATVTDLTWLTLGTHNSTLWVLRGYFQKRRLLLGVRVFLMACLASLMIAAVILQGHKDFYSNWNCRAQCVYGDIHGNIGGRPKMWMGLQLWWIVEGFVFSAVPHYSRVASFFGQRLYIAPREQLLAWTRSLADTTKGLWRRGNYHRL